MLWLVHMLKQLTHLCIKWVCAWATTRTQLPSVCHSRLFLAAVMNTIPIIFFVNSAEMFLKLSFLWVFFWLALAAYCNMKVLSKPFAELIDRSLHENEETTLMSTE